MLKTHYIAAILSFIGLVSVQVLSSPRVLAQFQRPRRDIQPSRSKNYFWQNLFIRFTTSNWFS